MPGELLPKKTKTSVMKSEVTSSTTPKLLPQPKKSSPVRLTKTGSQEPSNLTNLMFKSLRKLLPSTNNSAPINLLISRNNWLPTKLKSINQSSLTHMLTSWLWRTPP